MLRVLALTALAAAGGCATGDAGNPHLFDTDVAPMQKSQVMAYLIGPSDVLTISVWNHENLNRTVTVRPDGRLSFSLIGEIYAIGLTPSELQSALEKALGEYINIIPGEVSVAVDEVHSYKVSVLGEVHLPGRFEFQSQISVLDALAAAGGLTEFASASNIVILRLYEGETRKIRFDYQKIIKSKNNDKRVLIFPGDIILVP